LSAIVICHDVELGGFSPAALNALFRFTSDVSDRLRGARIAIVSSQPAVLSLLRTYERLGKPAFGIAAHATRAQAERWLGIGAHSPSP
jgi:hypothetical protein